MERPLSVEQRQAAEQGMTLVLSQFDNVTREGLRDTPRRYIKFLEEFLTPPAFNLTTFEGEGGNEMIVQANIPFYSLCEHHLAPFVGTGVIAYIPNGRIVGLSKLARTLDHFARRFQNQERITRQVADFLMQELEAKGVGVSLTAQHLCMAMRGVCKHNTHTTTKHLVGVFQDDPTTRSEFLKLVG